MMNTTVRSAGAAIVGIACLAIAGWSLRAAGTSIASRPEVLGFVMFFAVMGVWAMREAWRGR